MSAPSISRDFLSKWISSSILFTALLAGALGVCGCSNTLKFDSQRAFAHLKKQCAFGPRPLGSKAHDETKSYLLSELRKYADSVEIQEFEHKGYKLSNIIAQFGRTSEPSILLCAHWDTRPTADQELDPTMRLKPIMGANDGASGVAVLLELARLFGGRRPPVPVTIALFDGEDFGPTSKDMFLGSRYFAKSVDKSKLRYGILLDMVGDKDLQLPKEQYSQTRAPKVVEKVWAAAKSLGYGHIFTEETGFVVVDDHLPLLDKGVPCIDVIDFNYAYWHTLEDTEDKCSARSLGAVGETIAFVIYSERP